MKLKRNILLEIINNQQGIPYISWLMQENIPFSEMANNLDFQSI